MPSSGAIEKHVICAKELIRLMAKNRELAARAANKEAGVRVDAPRKRPEETTEEWMERVRKKPAGEDRQRRNDRVTEKRRASAIAKGKPIRGYVKSGLHSIKQQGDEKTPEETKARLLENNRLRGRQLRALESQDQKVARLVRKKKVRTTIREMIETRVKQWLESLEYQQDIPRLYALNHVQGGFFVHICPAHFLRNALPQFYAANGKCLNGILVNNQLRPVTRRRATTHGTGSMPMIAVWVRGQTKIADGVMHCKRTHKRTLKIAPLANKLACIWIRRRDPRASVFKLFSNFGAAYDELYFSKTAVSIEGLTIDIIDAGDYDDNEEEHDSDPADSDEDEYDRAVIVAERVAIANDTNDDEAGPMETAVVAEVVDAYVVDAELINLCSDDEP